MAPTATIDGVRYFIQSCYRSKGYVTANIGIAGRSNPDQIFVQFDRSRVAIELDKNLIRIGIELTEKTKAALRLFILLHCD